MNANDGITEKTPAPEKESGGVVTTVKAEESKDQDFQSRLKQMRADAGLNEDGTDPAAKVEEKVDEKPDADGEEKPAVVAKESDDDWQKDLTPEQRKKVNGLYRDLKVNRRETRELSEKLDRVLEQMGTAKPAAKTDEGPKVLQRPVRPVRPDPLKFAGTPEQFEQAEKDYDKAQEKYEDDLYAYRAQQDEIKKADEARKAADVETVNNFNKAVLTFSETHDDYADVMDNATNLVDEEMFGAIVATGPELGYYWATHPDESNKVANMAPGLNKTKAIMRTIIKIEDEAKAEKDKKPDDKKNKKLEDKKPPVPAAQVQQRKSNLPPEERPKTFKEKEQEAAKKGKLNYTP